MNSKRSKAITILYLSLIAVIPLIVGTYQVLHYLDWLFNLGINGFLAHTMIYASDYALLVCLVISFYERFCNFYRATVISVLVSQVLPFYYSYFPSIFSYNATEFVAIAVTAFSVIGCMIHFSIQINDFFRYARQKHE